MGIIDKWLDKNGSENIEKEVSEIIYIRKVLWDFCKYIDLEHRASLDDIKLDIDNFLIRKDKGDCNIFNFKKEHKISLNLLDNYFKENTKTFIKEEIDLIKKQISNLHKSKKERN